MALGLASCHLFFHLPSICTSLSPPFYFHLQTGNPTCCFRMTTLFLWLSTPLSSEAMRSEPSALSMDQVQAEHLLTLPHCAFYPKPWEGDQDAQEHKVRRVTLTDFSPRPGLLPAPPLWLAHCVNYVTFSFCRLLIFLDRKRRLL